MTVADHQTEPQPKPLVGGRFWQRLAITLVALLAYRVACQIPLPGLAVEKLDLRPSSSGLLGLLASTHERLSIAALGLWPIYTALMVSAAAKLGSGRFRIWVAASASNRAALDRLIGIVAIVMTAAQAFGYSAALRRQSQLLDQTGGLAGWEFEAGVIASTCAVTALLWWLCGMISRHGIGSGFWLLLLTPLLAKPLPILFLELARQGVISAAMLVVLAGVCISAAVVLVALRLARDNNSHTAPALDAFDEYASLWPMLLGVWSAQWLAYLAVYLAYLLGGLEAWGNAAIAHGQAMLALGLTPVFVAFLVAYQAQADLAVSRRSGTDVQSATVAPDPMDVTARMRLPLIKAGVYAALCTVGPALEATSNIPTIVNGAWLIILITVAVVVIDGARNVRPSAAVMSPLIAK